MRLRIVTDAIHWSLSQCRLRNITTLYETVSIQSV